MNGKKTNGAEQAEGENRRRDERENEKPTTTGFKREERRGPAWRRAERENLKDQKGAQDRPEKRNLEEEKRKGAREKRGG